MQVHAARLPVPITRFDSRGASYARLARLPAGSVGRLFVEPGGVVGAHEAPSRQVALVLAGGALVTGGDGASREVRAGDVVVFEPGERHETRAGSEGVVLLVVEGAERDAPAA